MEYNIDSKKIGRAPTKIYAKVLDEEDVKEKLKGYIEVDPEYYTLLPRNAHVRYFTNGGTEPEFFRVGGFFKGTIIDSERGEGMHITQSIKGGPPEFRIYFAEVSKLYKKISPDARIELMALKNAVKVQLDDLNTRVAALEAAAKKQ